MRPSSPGLLFVGSVLITDLISVVVVGLCRFSVLNSVFKDCVCLGMYPFFPDCPICCHVIRTVFLIYIFVVSVALSFLILFGSSLFFLKSLVKVLLIPLIFSKEPALGFIYLLCRSVETLFHVFLP